MRTDTVTNGTSFFWEKCIMDHLLSRDTTTIKKHWVQVCDTMLFTRGSRGRSKRLKASLPWRSVCYAECCPCSFHCTWCCFYMFLFRVEAVSVESCPWSCSNTRQAEWKTIFSIINSMHSFICTRIHKAPVTRLSTLYFCLNVCALYNVLLPTCCRCWR